MKMNNENEDLLDLKIEIIDNGNTKTFQEIALLIDKPEYLRLIGKIREEYPIYGGGNPVDSDFSDIYSSFFNRECNDINLAKYKSLANFQRLLPKDYKNVMASTKNTDMVLRLQTEAVLTCFEFGRPYYFVPITIQSFIYDAVDANFLQRTHAVVQDDDYTLYRFNEVKIPQVVIEMSPHSTYDDIKQAIRDSKKIFKTDQRFKYFGGKPDYHDEIRKYRYWYWERLAGKKFSEIAKEWNTSQQKKGFIDDTVDIDIIKAVKTYKELLQL